MSEFDNLNYAEYSVEKQCTGKYRLQRIGLKILTWLPFPILVVLFMMINIPIWYLLIPLYPWMWLKVIKPQFYPYVYIEYEYQIISGSFRMAKVYGKCRRKEMLDLSISKMLAIAPYRDSYKAAADAPDIQNRFECVSSMQAEEIYYALYEENGEKNVVFFEPTSKALKLMQFHNRNTVVTKVRF